MGMMTQVRVLGAAAALLCWHFVAVADAPKPMTSALRDDGTLMVNGKPVMPYGFYISTGHTGNRRLKCVEQVAKIGGGARSCGFHHGDRWAGTYRSWIPCASPWAM